MLSDNILPITGIPDKLKMTVGNNLEAVSGTKWSFVSVGQRSGISGIQSIPASGWASRVSLTPRQGILARYETNGAWGPEYEYVAIYVDRYLENKENGIIGVVLHYKTDFSPVVQATDDDVFYGEYSVQNKSLENWYLRFADTNHDGIISRDEALSVTVLGLDEYGQPAFGPQGIDSFEMLHAFKNLRELYIHDEGAFGTGKMFQNNINRVRIIHESLEKIQMRYVKTKELDLRNCISLRELDLAYSDIESVLLPASVEKVNISDPTGGGSMANLGTANCKNLRELNIIGNKLTALDLSACPALENLCVSRNPLASLDLSGLPQLRELYCSGCQIETLDISHNPNLAVLHVSGGALKTVIIPKGKTKRDYKSASGASASFSGIEVITEGKALSRESQLTQEKGIYHVGDTIHFGKNWGIVFSVFDGGRHGKAVGFPPYQTTWHNNYEIGNAFDGYKKASPEILNMFRTGATSMTDGKTNTDKIVRAARDIEAKTGNKLGKHGMLTALLSPKAVEGGYSSLYEQGWYIPAIDELVELYNAVAQDNLDEAFKKAGYREWRISRFNGYYSSTEFYDPSYNESFMECYVIWMPTGAKLRYHKNQDFDFVVTYIHAF